jgi:aerobic carbon-monoxide dehydrogenase medium subunit
MKGIGEDEVPLMIPKPFRYYAPASLDEAMRLLGENEEAKVLAGGQSLLPMMKLRLAAPTALVDITKISDLSYIREEGDHVAIGALTTHDAVEQDATVAERLSAIHDAVIRIGDQQVRNRGTIGGSACHADPAADMPTALLAMDAQFVIRGRKGARVVPAREFFVDVFATAVAHDEILTEIRLAHLSPRSASAYVKHSLREADFAIAMVGAALTMGGGDACKDVRLAIGSAGPTPLRAEGAEGFLRGKVLDEQTMAEAAEMVVEEVDPPSDVHGSREYRLESTKVLTRRALKLALSRVR